MTNLLSSFSKLISSYVPVRNYMLHKHRGKLHKMRLQKKEKKKQYLQKCASKIF